MSLFSSPTRSDDDAVTAPRERIRSTRWFGLRMTDGSSSDNGHVRPGWAAFVTLQTSEKPAPVIIWYETPPIAAFELKSPARIVGSSVFAGPCTNSDACAHCTGS